jgi:chaperonin GroEL (HSP60 family)
MRLIGELTMSATAHAHSTNAATVAGLLITTEAMVAERPEKRPLSQQQGGGGIGDMDH